MKKETLERRRGRRKETIDLTTMVVVKISAPKQALQCTGLRFYVLLGFYGLLLAQFLMYREH